MKKLIRRLFPDRVSLFLYLAGNVFISIVVLGLYYSLNNRDWRMLLLIPVIMLGSLFFMRLFGFLFEKLEKFADKIYDL